MKKFKDWLIENQIPDEQLYKMKSRTPQPKMIADEIEDAIRSGDQDILQYYKGWSEKDLIKYIDILREPNDGIPSMAKLRSLPMS